MHINVGIEFTNNQSEHSLGNMPIIFIIYYG